MKARIVHPALLLWLIPLVSILHLQCSKTPEYNIHFRIKFDALQDRFNSEGQITAVGAGRAAQTPLMNAIGIHSLELSTGNSIALGKGTQLMNTATSLQDGEQVIQFDNIKQVKESEIFLTVPMKELPIGRFEYLRVGVGYLNFDLLFNLMNVPFAGNFPDERGAMACFLSGNTNIGSHKIFSKTESVNGIRKQGYWSFESKLNPAFSAYNRQFNGQITNGTLTVVNPIHQTSPLPVGSDVITAKFDTPLSITGSETGDIYITLSFSNNRSFEWEESISRNGKWDYNAQANTGQLTVEKVVDAGLRGMKILIDSK
jgi:hypothetical protein